MPKARLFTSESVSEGHPDKMADQLSDLVVDALIDGDPHSRVAVETLIKDRLVVFAGEVRSRKRIGADLEKLCREAILDMGYTGPEVGFDVENCQIINAIGEQSADIAKGVDENECKQKRQGAGDQGLMFGYASRETDELMPAPVAYAHRLVRQQAKVRKEGILDFLRPDAKSQVTLCYGEDDQPTHIDAVVLSTQHNPDVSGRQLEEAVREEIIKPVLLPTRLFTEGTRIYINPTGRFVEGGPFADCGLTGRKIIVDTYGGMARHGGGAFSGKDPTKVDRSAAYACRYVAKNLVAAGLADRCEIQVSYAIGVDHPISISVETFGTGKLSEERIVQLIERHFDLTPKGLIEMLDLHKPIYRPTATYGHFGRSETEQGHFTWENTDMAEKLLAEL